MAIPWSRGPASSTTSSGGTGSGLTEVQKKKNVKPQLYFVFNDFYLGRALDLAVGGGWVFGNKYSDTENV